MTQPTAGKHGCTGRRRAGKPCDGHPIRGTDRCKFCCGIPLHKQRAKGEIVLELRRWGLAGEDLVDPGETLLRLVTQSSHRVELYSSLLQQAYEAAERLRDTEDLPDDLPPHRDNNTDRQRAVEDLDRVFTSGGVAALIGVKWAATKSGEFSVDLYQVEEGLRGLVQLEAAERDRCATFAAKAVAAGLAERQVRLAEQQGALVAEVIRASLADLGHDPADPQVQRVVSTRLHALSGGAA